MRMETFLSQMMRQTLLRNFYPYPTFRSLSRKFFEYCKEAWKGGNYARNTRFAQIRERVSLEFLFNDELIESLMKGINK